MSGIASAVMKLELIYVEVFSLLFGFYELLAVIGRIDALETFFITFKKGMK